MTTESEHIAKFKCRTVTAEDLPYWAKETLFLIEMEPNLSFELDCMKDEVNPKDVWVEVLEPRGFPLPTWAKEKLSKTLDSNDSDDSNSPEDVEMISEIEPKLNLTL